MPFLMQCEKDLHNVFFLFFLMGGSDSDKARFVFSLLENIFPSPFGGSGILQCSFFLQKSSKVLFIPMCCIFGGEEIGFPSTWNLSDEMKSNLP